MRKAGQKGGRALERQDRGGRACKRQNRREAWGIWHSWTSFYLFLTDLKVTDSTFNGSTINGSYF